jgi:hypothetical protein
LGVKLGHRRVISAFPAFLTGEETDVLQKLQRRIANARGIAPSVSLPLKPKPDEVKQDGSRQEPTKPEGSQEGAGVVKRKYRRHPKVSQICFLGTHIHD